MLFYYTAAYDSLFAKWLEMKSSFCFFMTKIILIQKTNNLAFWNLLQNFFSSYDSKCVHRNSKTPQKSYFLLIFLFFFAQKCIFFNFPKKRPWLHINYFEKKLIALIFFIHKNAFAFIWELIRKQNIKFSQ
jgi:hypothetical protein